jgi:hypothetical protein
VSVTGITRRVALTSALSSISGSLSRWRKSWTAVNTSSSPKIRNMNENAEISAAPRAMKIARMTSAKRIPNVRTRRWYSAGTANVDMITTKTKRLSTDRLFSTM